MSNHNRSIKFNALIFLIVLSLLIINFPIAVLIIGFTLLLYFIKIEGLIVSAISTALIFMILIIGIYIPNYFDELINKIQQVINFLSNGKILDIFLLSFKNSAIGWITNILIAICISGIFANRLEYKSAMYKSQANKTNKPTIKPLNNVSSVPTSTPTILKTVIGIDMNNYDVRVYDNAKHVFICGTTGSGKTVALSNFIESGMSKKYGMLLVDGKGDIGKDSMIDISLKLARKYNRTIYVIDMNNPTHSNLYNPFQNTSPTICKDMLINMTDWSEEHYKANTERLIQRLVKLLNLKGGILYFKRIIKYIDENNFIYLTSMLCKSGKITKDEHLENLQLYQTSGKIAQMAAARFATISESEIGTIFDHKGIDIYTVLAQKAIILFVLNPLIYPEMSQVMGRLVLIDAKKAVSKLYQNNSNRKFFLFDEINVYASNVLIDLINKSRSANVTAILATQSLADLEANVSEAFKQQVIENCNNYIVMRQNSAKSAEEWAKILGTKETMQMTYQIGKPSYTDIDNQGDTTGLGTARKTREFLYHPDDIKNLRTGEAIFLTRDRGKHCRFKVKKPF